MSKENLNLIVTRFRLYERACYNYFHKSFNVNYAWRCMRENPLLLDNEWLKQFSWIKDKE